MANKKLKLLYLARYLREETDERHPRTVQDMIAYLERQGISAERKSIYDDLELLELYGMDVQAVRGKTYGYFLGEREFQLPELKLLIDVVQASPFLTQSKSMELIAKLEQLTSRPNARQLRRQVYVMDRVRTHNEKLYYAIDGLNTAINDDRKVTFRYFDWTPDGGKAYRRGGTPYETNPVALCVDKHYYLVAYDISNQEMRHYRVDKMAEIVVTGYGICGRIARSAVKLLRAKGHKVGFIRPKTLYPFPADVYAGLDFDRVKAILDVEMCIPAQMVDDIRLAINDRCPIETCLHAGGEIMGRGEVMDAVRKLLEG